MKKLLPVILLISTAVQASELVVVDISSSEVSRSEKLSSKLVVKDSVPYVRFDKTRVSHVGPRNSQVTFVNSSYHQVDGLELRGKELVYTSAEGETKCGKLIRREFGVPRMSIVRNYLQLTGSCMTKVKKVNDGVEKRIQVIFSI